MRSSTTLKQLLQLPFESRPRAQVVAELAQVVLGKLPAKKAVQALPKLVFTPNPEQLMLALRSPEFAAALPQADYLLPDGEGLVWALNKTGTERFSRLAGVEVLDDVFRAIAQSGESARVLVIGGRDLPGTPNTALGVMHLPEWYQNVSLLWSLAYKDVTHPTEEEEAALLLLLKKVRPHGVCVALGAPYQEEWLIRHRSVLTTAGVRIAMTVGGAFDMLSGKIPRAPKIIRALRLEWLYRLVREPWRWRRQLRLIEFVWRVMTIA